MNKELNEENNKMDTKKSNDSKKSNIRFWIGLIFIFISIIVGLCWTQEGVRKLTNSCDPIVVATIVFVFAGGLLITGITLILIDRHWKKKFYNADENHLYFFNFENEYKTYRRIGKKANDKNAKNYSEWKTGLLEKHEKLKDNEDFYRYMKGMYRNKISASTMNIGIMAPVLLLLVQPGVEFATGSQVGSIIGINWISYLILVVYVLILVTSGYENAQNEANFIEDVIEVLCPSKVGNLK